MHWLRHLYRSTQRQSPSIPRPRSRVPLCLEGLETRLAPASVFVVPLSQQSDSTHLHELVAAVNAAGPSGVVTIEPGASPDPVQPVGGEPVLVPSPEFVVKITSRSGSRTGSWFSSSPLKSEKMAVFAPMPIASVRIAIAAKPGFFASSRTA